MKRPRTITAAEADRLYRMEYGGEPMVADTVPAHRYGVLPLAEDADGSLSLALPGMLGGATYDANALLRAGMSARDMARTGKVMDLAIGGPGAVNPLAAAARSALPIQAKSAINNRSIKAGFRPPKRDQRAFHEDYKTAPRHDDAGKLETTVDGHRLFAPFVAGRRRLGGGDEGLTPIETDQLARGLVGGNVSPASRSALPGEVGKYFRGAGPDAPERRILYRNDLTEKQIPNVLAHEAGHVIDDLAAEIPTAGLHTELRRVYHDLATGDTWRTKNLTGPQHLGYPKSEVRAEHMAEAIRAYLQDPNYLKSVAPETAAKIREFANNNPRINRLIQFNALPSGVNALTQAVRTGAMIDDEAYP